MRVIALIYGIILTTNSNLCEYLKKYFSSGEKSDFSEFSSGILLGLSVGMKIVGIILLLISIIKYKGK